ncbi:2'-5' RNA ligase family protein [Chondromyces crocatus]|uniref:APS kinase domain-containing protein n=1 Tax=Chondromyces crocatus TaxID=52 RepID=A0A0K1ER68_CHOCO|nr:2'-5' RNA ligase family protein [Chondromyces crocatus]AKT43319.1 uncharacterized protein CMC5_075510 [Chondromyces crocatus]
MSAIVWFSGSSSSDATALARRARERLLSRGRVPVVLDGEGLRPLLVLGDGESDGEGRGVAASSALAGMLARQGHVVLVAAGPPPPAHPGRLRAEGVAFIEVRIGAGVEARDGQPSGEERAGESLPGETTAGPGVGAQGDALEHAMVSARGADDDGALDAVFARLATPERRPMETVYVALRVAPTPEVLRAQQAFCERFGLVPREELHLTLAYLGEVEPESLGALTTALLRVARERPLLTALSLEGGGAAVRSAMDGAPLELTVEALRRTDVRKVAWWAVRSSEALDALHREVSRAVRACGHAVESGFWPHVTLGSNAPTWAEARFDVHGVPKRGAFGDCPAVVTVDRLHITDTVTHPESLVLLARPSMP